MAESLSKEELRRLDSKAKEILGIPENILIENASRGVLESVLDRGISFSKTAVFAGRGNNAADSLAFARHSINRGSDVDVFLVLNGKPYNPQVEFQLSILKKVLPPGKIKELHTSEDFEKIILLDEKILIVDGIFGIGFIPPLREFYARLFGIINNSKARVLSIDIPSGMSADKGVLDNPAVKADITVTFLGMKKGFLPEKSREFLGDVEVKDIGVSYAVLEKL